LFYYKTRGAALPYETGLIFNTKHSSEYLVRQCDGGVSFYVVGGGGFGAAEGKKRSVISEKQRQVGTSPFSTKPGKMGVIIHLLFC
jgi:hypothetical protein